MGSNPESGGLRRLYQIEDLRLRERAVTEIGSDKGTILVVGAHPDDETLGCGASLAGKIRAGYDVFICVLTDGRGLLTRFDIMSDPSPEEVARIRKQETLRATRLLGMKEGDVLFLDYENGKLAEHVEEATEKLARLIRERSPVEVWSLNEYEGHPEHVEAGRIARSAGQQAPGDVRQLQYAVGLKYDLSPEVIDEVFTKVDVTDWLPPKREAISQFRSHLDRLSEKQEAPLWQNADRYLKPYELFVTMDEPTSS